MKGTKRLNPMISSLILATVFGSLGLIAFSLDARLPPAPTGKPLHSLLWLLAMILFLLCLTRTMMALTYALLKYHKRPSVEGGMITRIYRLAGGLAIALAIISYYGQIGAFWSFFSLFGGMLLGWSLQTPITGFAAWILISLKRPFRPGDRIQFPSLSELTGDVRDIGLMYTELEQVGGSVGSEEAVGRHILIPTAMLFSEVIINYTTVHELSYMLDEIVVRITYDSDWDEAEQVLLRVAQEVTGDIIKAKKKLPYIRSDLYDYGVYMQLRYHTRVKDRAEIAYRINKRIFEEIQKNPKVDIAIPYIYSFRAGVDIKGYEPGNQAIGSSNPTVRAVTEIQIDLIEAYPIDIDPKEIDLLAKNIARHGLLQPIVVGEIPERGTYDIITGHLRYEACKRLGWNTITAIVRGPN
jgi:small-conductance mechanosensitive channel